MKIIMKKVMILAMMMVASATAFAGDSDGLKAIMKAKTYDEANQLLKQNLASLADNAEKAKAYNHLVDLAMIQVKRESDIIKDNLAAPLTGSKIKDYDTLSLCDGVVKSIEAALECDKYDQLPNAKGKVAPKFAEKNAQRVWADRFPHLVTYGDALRQNGKKEEALRYWNAFISSSTNPFFEKQDKKSDKQYYSQIAYLAGRVSADIDRIEDANRYYEIAMKDTAWSNEAALFLIVANKAKIKTPADTAKLVSYLTELSKQYPKNDQLYGTISDLYIQQGKTSDVIRLANERIANCPESELPHVYKAFILMNEKKYDDAIKEFGVVKEAKTPVFLNSVYNMAVCKYNKASDFYEAKCDPKTGRISAENEKIHINMLLDAQKDFEKTKEYDPNQETVKWAYLLKNIYSRTNQQDKADAIQ